MKITKPDIAIIPEGQQVKKIIYKMFKCEVGLSELESCADFFGVSVSTLQAYTSYRKLSSFSKKSLKKILKWMSDEGLSVNLIKSQLDSYFIEISKNILTYDSEEDTQLFDELVRIASKEDYKHYELLFRAQRAFNFYNLKMDAMAYRELNDIISDSSCGLELAKSYALSVLALIEILNGKPEMGLKYVRKAKKLYDSNWGVNEIVSRCYYVEATAMRRTDYDSRHKKARTLYRKALMHTAIDNVVINCHNGIALCFRMEGNFKKALKEYNTALYLAENKSDIDSQLLIKNNIAYLYMHFNQIEMAEKIVLEAYEYVTKSNYKDRVLTLLDTLLDVYIKKNTSGSDIKEYIVYILDELRNVAANREQVVSLFSKLIKTVGDTLDEEIIDIIKSNLKMQIAYERNGKRKKELYAIYGEFDIQCEEKRSE